MKKRILSLLLAACLVFGLMSVPALAADGSADYRTFTDMDSAAWYYSYAKYCCIEGIMSGTSAAAFSPAAAITRAEIWQIEYNMAGSPGTDAEAGLWYSDALAWVVKSGISDGTDPTGPVTREQLVTMLYRYAVYKGMDAVTLEENLTGFSDAASVSEFAVTAMSWAVGREIIAGTDGALRPLAGASRAEAAKIFACYDGEVNMRWENSDVEGAVKASTVTDPTEDLTVYVNKDWVVSSSLDSTHSTVSSFSQAADEVVNKVTGLLEGGELGTHEGRLVQTLYGDYMDMDARNELGIEPIKPYLEKLAAISTMEELTAYLSGDDSLSEDMATWYCSLDTADGSKTSVYIRSPRLTLEDADLYRTPTAASRTRLAATRTLLEKQLVRVGYSQTEAAAAVDKCYSYESELGKAMLGASAQTRSDYFKLTYNPMSLSQLKEVCANYPIEDTVKAVTDVGVDNFIIDDTGWLKQLNALYVPENLDRLKAWLICRTVFNTIDSLDQESLDIYDEYVGTIDGISYKTDMKTSAYETCSSLLDMATARVLCDGYVTAEMKSDVAGIIDECVAVYKKRLEKIDWLGSETRAAAIEKLNKLTVRIGGPEDWTQYGYDALTLKSKAEGGTLISNTLLIQQFDTDRQAAIAGGKAGINSWEMLPQEINAFYNASDNSINILAGILTAPFYDANASRETNLGSIGFIVGHEITHAFDSQGSQFDGDGRQINWWTDADRAAFQKRTQKVSDYFSTILALPGMFIDGDLTNGEAVADLGGMSCTLEIARKEASFNYKEYFTAIATMWRTIRSPERAVKQMSNVHPPAYLRVNVTVQQFEEFYTAFGVKEGDGMYLPPEERLSVW